jgi:predicted small integral membrane protein
MNPSTIPSPLEPSVVAHHLTARWAKLLLIASVALFFTLVAFNNLTDFDSNYQFVRHVLMMDSTFPGNHGLWRAIHTPAIHVVFYLGIIAWEILNAVFLWCAALTLFRARLGSVEAFQRAKRLGVAALTAGMLLWMVAFITVGGEWFLMWQSRLWNGQDAAFRMFTVEGIILVILLLPEAIQ